LLSIFDKAVRSNAFGTHHASCRQGYVFLLLNLLGSHEGELIKCQQILLAEVCLIIISKN
jgi:hypothetical protein